MQKIKLLRPMSVDNPYTTGSLPWHLWLDLKGVLDAKPVGHVVSLQLLADYNFSEPEFYLENLDELVRDGWIELTNSN